MPKDEKVLEALAHILKALVDYPENVTINRTTDEQGSFIQIFVDRRDMGLVVGRKGSHIEAIKLIAKLVAFKYDAQVSIKLEEPK